MALKHSIKRYVEGVKLKRRQNAKEISERRDKQFQQIVNGGDLSDYYEDLKDREAEGKRSWFRKVSGITPVNYSIVGPTIPTYIQMAIEKSFFSLSDEDFEAMLAISESSPSLIRKLRNKNLRLYKYNPKAEQTPESLFLNYWPIVFFSLLLFAVVVYFVFWEVSGYVPFFGMVSAIFLLWLVKWAAIKRELGLKFFCPFTINYLTMMLYNPDIEETDNGKEKSKEKNGTKKKNESKIPDTDNEKSV